MIVYFIYHTVLRTFNQMSTFIIPAPECSITVQCRASVQSVFQLSELKYYPYQSMRIGRVYLVSEFR